MEECYLNMGKTDECVLNALKNLSPFSFSSTLMQYYKDIVSKSSPAELLKNYQTKINFFGCASVPLKQTIKDAEIFLECLHTYYDFVELSPAMPLGTNSIITKISQNTVASTIRSGEIIADPTTALVLEGARRRKMKKGNDEVNLATMCRVLRIQKFDDPNFYPHFNSFALASLVYSSYEKKFTYKKFIEHISIYLDYMLAQNKYGFMFKDIEVRISSIRLLNEILSTLSEKSVEKLRRNSLNETYDFLQDNNIEIHPLINTIEELPVEFLKNKNIYVNVTGIKLVFDNVVEVLRSKYKMVNFTMDLGRKAGLGYYKDLCFHILAHNCKGEKITLADGGEVSWASLLLSDNKERAIVSGFGLEMSQLHFLSSVDDRLNNG